MHKAIRLTDTELGEYIVPGTSFKPAASTVRRIGVSRKMISRDASLRGLYLEPVWHGIRRLLGSIDRNPYRPTYGCLDRQYWHYRTSSFPSEMYQEGVLPLALVYSTRLPGNPWYQVARVRELAIAGIRFSARSCHRDGSCDDYYPFERALGAAVFSLQAATRAYEVLELDDPEVLDWFRRRGKWLIRHDEAGRLANHQALAALGLLRVGRITGESIYREAAEERIDRLIAWQSDEGWFEEYGGADPGYQTISIDCLAKCRQLVGKQQWDGPLRRAVAFARYFLHPDGSYGGEYGSRGTHHFYPHGMELLSAEDPDAADLADGYLRGVSEGKQAEAVDDRLFAHCLANLIEAYLDWSPNRPVAHQQDPAAPTHYFPKAQMLVYRTPHTQTAVSAARGGVFRHFAEGREAVCDAGLILETTSGRIAVSQMHTMQRAAEFVDPDNNEHVVFSVAGPLHWSSSETATPLKQALLHVGMATVGRFCRGLVRRLLQRRLITGRRECPVQLHRVIEFLGDGTSEEGGINLRVTDTIELTRPRIRVARMSFGTDHQAAYVAACNIYQPSVSQPWTDLQPHVDELNTERCVTIVREF